MFGLPPGPFPHLTSLPTLPPICVVTLEGFEGLGHSVTFDTINKFGNRWVLSRPFCLLSRPLLYSELVTLRSSFNGLERTALTVRLVVFECNGLESTVKTGIFMLNLTRTLMISLCT